MSLTPASRTGQPSASASPGSTGSVGGTGADAVDTPGPVTGTVSLPAGAKIGLASLTVQTSVGSAAVSANGTFTVQAFPNGHVLATVTLPNGDPLLFAFIGPKSTTVDAASTAGVLAFYACDAFTLTPDVRAQAPALIEAVPGFGALTSAVATALGMGADPFATPSASVAAALTSYVASVRTGTGTAARRLRDAETISPVGASTGSGVSLIQDFPNGVHFLNFFRRRAVAEIDRQSYVPAGSTAPVPAPTRLTATPVPVPPVNGLNAGVISSIDDIFQNFFNEPGNPSAYAPVASASVPLPLVDGSSSTTYLVTLLGPGGDEGLYSSLSSADRQTQFNTELYYFVVDLAIPLITTVVLPLEANAVDKALSEGAADVISELLSDGGTLVPQLITDFQPDANGHIDPLPAINDAVRNLFENPAYTNTLEQYIAQVVELKFGANAATQITERLGFFNKYVEAFDFGLAAFDSTVVGQDLVNSNEADQFTIVTTADKLTLTPQSQTVSGTGTGTLTATDLSDTGSGATPLQYTWTNTAHFGHLTDGVAGHVDNFTSTHATVTYTPSGGTGTDTVTVQFGTLKGPGTPSQPIGSPVTAIVSTSGEGQFSVSPAGCHNFNNGLGSLTYTVSTSLIAPANHTLEFGWRLPSGRTPSYGASFSDPGSTYEGSQYVGASASATLTIDDVIPAGYYDNVSISVQPYFINNTTHLSDVSTYVDPVYVFYSYGNGSACSSAQQ